jgi:inhibitor of KinA sporulation pathway (predicted exonuclease)
MQLIIFDTEFTAWEGSKERSWSESWEHRELIQLAAAKLTLKKDGVELLESFNELVKPTVNPILSDYIAELTGISQGMVDDMGVDFSSAINAFYQFCEQGELACFAWGNDGKILTENCFLNRLEMPDFSAGFFNLNQLARNAKIDGAHLCSGELASHLGLELNGHVHNALYDVRSISLALNYWMGKGVFSSEQLIKSSKLQ